MNRLILIFLLAMPSHVSAIVIRHDVADSEYRAAATEFPALVDLPGEGRGVFITPQWVVTAAHAVSWQAEIKQVVLDGKARAVEKIIVHPGYKKLPQPLIDQAIKTNDATQIIEISLLKTTSP